MKSKPESIWGSEYRNILVYPASQMDAYLDDLNAHNEKTENRHAARIEKLEDLTTELKHQIELFKTGGDGK